jgi:hypothetical protein
MSKTSTWINTSLYNETYRKRPTISFRYEGRKYRERSNNGNLRSMKGNISIENVIEFYEGFTGKKLDYNYNLEDFNLLHDIIRLSENKEELKVKLGRILTELDMRKKYKVETEPKIKSIW